MATPDNEADNLESALESLMLDVEGCLTGDLQLVPAEDSVLLPIEGPSAKVRRRLSIDWASKVFSWTLPAGAGDQVASLSSRQRSEFRDRWCVQLLRRRPHLKADGYNEGLKQAKKLWQELPDDHRTGWLLHMSDNTKPSPPYPSEDTGRDKSVGTIFIGC